MISGESKDGTWALCMYGGPRYAGVGIQACAGDDADGLFVVAGHVDGRNFWFGGFDFSGALGRPWSLVLGRVVDGETIVELAKPVDAGLLERHGRRLIFRVKAAGRFRRIGVAGGGAVCSLPTNDRALPDGPCGLGGRSGRISAVSWSVAGQPGTGRRGVRRDEVLQ